jgi:putative endonuclease
VRARTVWVYILANAGGRAATLYTGVTNDLERRVYEHKHPDPKAPSESFTARYRVTRLVYVEDYGDMREAIAREKQIKGWRRDRKLALIESINPDWCDLSERWGKFEEILRCGSE